MIGAVAREEPGQPPGRQGERPRPRGAAALWHGALIYIYIYTYRERERERESEIGRYIYIYIYIYV